MKLIMVLLVLISRELLSPEWRALLAKPSYWWRDTWLTIAEKQRLAAPVVLALLALLPILLFALLLMALQHSYHVAWQLLWALMILVPVFTDRKLPTVLAQYREQWLSAERVTQQELDLARHQLFDSYIKELFAPLFWVFVLGVWGVLLVSIYYSCRICQAQQRNLPLSATAERMLAYLDWLPSRAVVLSFALVGQFMPTWLYWREQYNTAVSPLTFVEQAVQYAENTNDTIPTSSDQSTWIAALASYEALCFRVIVLWVILLVLQLV